MLRKLIPCVLLLLAATPALAGRGATYDSVMGAIATNNGDVIASELERAEFLTSAAVVGPVMELLDHKSYQVREAAAWWFARRPLLAAAVTMQSIARIQSGTSEQAEFAADVLGSLQYKNPIPVIASGLARTDLTASGRVALVRALGKIADPSGMPAVVGALADATPEARAEAIRSYDSIRGAHSGAELAPLVTDPDVAVRRQAAATVGQYKVAAARADLENLLLHDSDPLVRRNAAWALMKIADSASRAALQQAAANDSIAYVRGTAKAALAGPLK